MFFYILCDAFNSKNIDHGQVNSIFLLMQLNCSIYRLLDEWSIYKKNKSKSTLYNSTE